MKADRQTPAFSRDVAKRTKRPRRAYVMCSPKSGFVEVRLESRLEQSVAQALELDPRVRAYRAQPYTLDLLTGERLAAQPASKKSTVSYTPDFEAEVGELVVAIEVKPRAFLKRHAELFERVRVVLRRQGVRFLVVSEESFPGHYLRNIALLMPYLSQASQALEGWAAPLQRRSPEELSGPVAEVLEGLEPANYHVAAGVLLGVIQFDLVQHLFEQMDFILAPAFGALNAFEVIRYE
ncbi:hypothetical protein [Geopseudomonas aromaticivorans]|nr:hypothetical protein [Pseudomonas aromaticivorans]